MQLKNKIIKKKIKEAIKEDLPSGDVTSDLLEKKSQNISALIISREAGIVCGTEVAAAVFKELSGKVKIKVEKNEGDTIRINDTLMSLEGPADAILAGERIALNFLGHMSGVATLTSKFVKKAKAVNGAVEIYDTRKTLPGLRDFEKYAVTVGGGKNHRMNLSEQVLLKENHIALDGKGIGDLTARAAGSIKKKMLLEVEVESLAQLKDVLGAGAPQGHFLRGAPQGHFLRGAPQGHFLRGADIIMLDNFEIDDIKEARKMARLMDGDVKLEVSGGITLNNIAAYASTGVDRISAGMLTSSVPALDYSLLMEL
ncbi:MAG: carboxylating nicotinate-nucleotide diphosphorylase [Elusimicrobiota bacterium]|nr:carboxylating nicotinate-nucleotide diphosphorylase [Elusimicrobiota bacterium]